jgi:hypothetical protein
MTSATAPQHSETSAAGSQRALLARTEYRIISYVLLAATAGAAAYFAAAHDWYKAAALSGLALLGGAFIAAKTRLPSLFTLLFLLAALVNTSGYLFDLWKTPLWFDEFVHAFTSFTIAAAIGWVALARTRMRAEANGWKLTLAVTGIGLVLGIVWEVFEWIIGIIGSPADTVVDLIMDSIGALLAGIFAAWAGKEDRLERERSEAHSRLQ